MKLTVLAAIVVTALAGSAVAGSGHCDADMKAVETAMASAKLSDADMATVKATLAKGEEMHKAGKEEECEKSLAGAQKLLGIKDEHKH